MENGWKSNPEVAAEYGNDIEDVLQERQREEQLAADLGVTLGAPPKTGGMSDAVPQ